jgi:(+)-trans-carveol dehydrogenase
MGQRNDEPDSSGLESPGLDDIAAAAVHHVLPMGWVEPADITRAVLFLAAEEPAG